jgi:hypothetical protein
MRKVLRSGFDQLEILGKNDSILKFRDAREAVEFLRRFSRSPVKMALLRSIATEHSLDVHRLTAEQILAQIGLLLISGKIRILRSMHTGGTRAEEQEESSAQTGGSDPPPKKADWIEINLRDALGQPIPQERYRIKLPDGSIQEGALDVFGHAEFYDINSGNCEVSFPDREDDEWVRI